LPGVLLVYNNTRASPSSNIGYRTLMYSIRKLYQQSKRTSTWGPDHRMSPRSSTTGLGMWLGCLAQTGSVDNLLALHTQLIQSGMGDSPGTVQSPRRLFPRGRTPWSTLPAPKTASLCRYVPNKTVQRRKYDLEDYEQDSSDDGSLSSNGTVLMAASPILDLPDPDSWSPLEYCYPVDQACTPYPAHHVDENLGDVSSQICASRPGTTSIAPDDAITSPSYHTQTTPRKVRINSKPEFCGAEPKLELKVTQSLPNLREASNQFGLEHECPTRSEDAIYLISSWDASVQLYTNATMSQKGKIKIHHHVHLSVTFPKQKIDTARICLNLIITNGVQGKHTHHLEAGHSSLYLDDGVSAIPSSEPAKAEIEIIRNINDMERPMDLYFTMSHSTSDHSNSMQVLPSFRPSNGKVLSESVSLREPDAPLIMKTKARSLYSTWKATPHPLSKVARFERIDTPPLYPLGLRDDLRIEIIENAAVKFQSLNALAATDVVWNFDIEIQQLLGMALECRMSLYLEVEKNSNRLLTIDPHGWIPTLFLVDGGLATEQAAEWRQIDGQLVLFKQAHMLLGPIKLELNWQEPLDTALSNGECPCELFLPRVLDHEVLRGSLKFQDIGTVFLTQPGAKDHIELESGTYLPTMHKEHRLYLNRNPKSLDAPRQLPGLSPIPEGVEADSDGASADSTVAADTDSGNSFITAINDEAAQRGSQPSLGPIPDLEANNDPDGSENSHQDKNGPRGLGDIGWIPTLVFLIITVMILGSMWQLRIPFPPELPDGDSVGNVPDIRLSHDVENLTYPPVTPLGNPRLSNKVEDLGPRVASENLGLGLETLTDAMIAGTESYGLAEDEVGGWRWWRDKFDYTFGWTGPGS